MWKEGRGPDVVLEVTSRSTRSEDQGPKRGLYALLGVREYFQYDPTGDYLLPALQGGRLNGDHYTPIAPVLRSNGDESPGGVLALRSEVLSVEFRLVGGRLAVYDPASGQKLLTYAEAQDARAQERAARLAAEAEVARLRQELARLRGD